jgi:flagellar motor switch protein FliN/FliY
MAAKAKKPESPEQGDLAVAAGDNLEQLQDMDVEVSIELGRNKLTLDDALELGEQSLIELDKVVGEPVDIRLNGKLFARGEVVTVAENFGVRLLEVVKQGEGREV